MAPAEMKQDEVTGWRKRKFDKAVHNNNKDNNCTLFVYSILSEQNRRRNRLHPNWKCWWFYYQGGLFEWSVAMIDIHQEERKEEKQFNQMLYSLLYLIKHTHTYTPLRFSALPVTNKEGRYKRKRRRIDRITKQPMLVMTMGTDQRYWNHW